MLCVDRGGREKGNVQLALLELGSRNPHFDATEVWEQSKALLAGVWSSKGGGKQNKSKPSTCWITWTVSVLRRFPTFYKPWDRGIASFRRSSPSLSWPKTLGLQLSATKGTALYTTPQNPRFFERFSDAKGAALVGGPYEPF